MTAQKEASHPLFYKVGSRRLRRRLVVVTYGGWLLVAAIVELWSLSSTSHGWYAALPFLVIANSIFQLVWMVWLGRTYVNAPRLADAELDERLLQIKNLAYRRAYLVIAPVAVISWLLSLAALQWQPNDQGRVITLVLVAGVALLMGTLPTTIVAWQEPDPEPWTAEPVGS
jgi:hypothetical protein